MPLDPQAVPILEQFPDFDISALEPALVRPLFGQPGPQVAGEAVAAGADGVMLEVHPDPFQALCDGPQSLRPAEFATLAAELRALAPFIARQRETLAEQT